MRDGGCMRFVAVVSGFAVSREGALKELDYHINRRMKELYREGCRRFRVVFMARTGDAERRIVIGWPN